MPAQIEQIGNRSMSAQEPLSLPDRFKLSHTSLSNACRLMGLLSPIVGILAGVMNGIRNYFPVRHSIAPQFICHDLSGFTSMAPYQSLEEALGRSPIPASLQIYIYYLAVLVNCAPEVMLLAIDLDEDFIDVEGITVASMLSLQPSSI